MRSKPSRKKANYEIINSKALIADFQTANMLLQAISNANYQANQAENATLDRFSNYKHQGDPYVKPQDLPFEDDKSLTHASLNSHLQKVQSKQIEQHGLQTIRDLENNALNNYIDKKVTIRTLDNKNHPFHNSWLDQRTGENYFGNNHNKSISGKIIEINLTKNYIILKPSAGRQFVNKALRGYLSEVINYSTGIPFVEIEF